MLSLLIWGEFRHILESQPRGVVSSTLPCSIVGIFHPKHQSGFANSLNIASCWSRKSSANATLTHGHPGSICKLPMKVSPQVIHFHCCVAFAVRKFLFFVMITFLVIRIHCFSSFHLEPQRQSGFIFRVIALQKFEDDYHSTSHSSHLRAKQPSLATISRQAWFCLGFVHIHSLISCSPSFSLLFLINKLSSARGKLRWDIKALPLVKRQAGISSLG